MIKDQNSDTTMTTSIEPASRPIGGSLKPLGICLLVEYRLSSRTRLERCVTSTHLFESIEESGSLHACLSAIARKKVDACIFGPSVKMDKIREFLGRLSETDAAKSCAVIVARRLSTSEPVDGAHSMMDFPCSQGAFNAGVVRALSRVYGGQLPDLQTIDPDSGKLVSLRDLVDSLEYPDNESADSIIRDSRPSIWPRETFEAVLKRSRLFRERLGEIQPFNLGFRSDGSPTEFTSETVLGLLNVVFPDTDGIPGMSKFKLVLEELIYKWAQIGTQLGRRTADTCLRREIINCFGMNIQ